MPSSFDRNLPNFEQGRCSIIRTIKGLGHDEYMFVHENNVGHTYPTMRCNKCKQEWDLNDEQMQVFIKQEDEKHKQWTKDHECPECGNPHIGSYFSTCKSWKEAGESFRRQFGLE